MNLVDVFEIVLELIKRLLDSSPELTKRVEDYLAENKSREAADALRKLPPSHL